ncbi:fibronectin type III domain-containing protein [bacterium]|nr:fibronectin type III domain-containing protein [bacterium]
MSTANKTTILMRSLIAAVALIAALIAGAPTLKAQPAPPTVMPLFFTAVVGGDLPYGRRVLLRWYTMDNVGDLESAVIFRTDGSGNRVKLSVVKPVRNEAAVLGLFARPGEHRIRRDANEVLTRIFGPDAALDENFGARVIELLEGTDDSDFGASRRLFLVQGNYGFALAEGLGYLDFVDPGNGPYEYELWEGDAAGNPMRAIGDISVAVSTPDELPAPTNLREVQLVARDGATPALANNQRIYLNWDVPPELESLGPISFGYNVYRLDRFLNTGETFDDVENEVHKINDAPILAPSPIEGEDPSQTYIYVDAGDWLEGGDLLPVGATYTYFVRARDLLGQEGVPSDPLKTTVRDTEGPGTPDGLAIISDLDANTEPILQAMWNQVDDAAGYRLYRYQDYTHVSRRGPFADIGGLTEGLIADVAPPANPGDKVRFLDMDVNNSQLGKTFWYCVSAVDLAGNESPLSPPSYGAIDDVTGPSLSDNIGYCVTVNNLGVEASRVDKTGLPSPGYWDPSLKFVPNDPIVVIGRAYRLFPGNPDVLVAEIHFDGRANEVKYASDPMPWVTTQAELPTYRFEFVAIDGKTASATQGPPSEWLPGDERPEFVGVAYPGPAEGQACGDLEVPDMVWVTPGGNEPPVDFDVPCGEGVESVRLYRSLDGCQTYDFVGEFPCEGGTINIPDDFHIEGMAEVCYQFRGVDEHGNIGPAYTSPITFTIAGEIPNPTMIEVVATGTWENPGVDLVWMGPEAGVNHYRVFFSQFSEDPERPLEFAVYDLNYDPSTSEFVQKTSFIDRDGTILDPAAEYEVRVEAVLGNGVSKASNVIPFQWGAAALQEGEFKWPPRPLPPTVMHPYPLAFFFMEDKGMLVRINREPLRYDKNYVIEALVPQPPFMVWRQRTDVPDQPWIPVSPVIESIKTNFGALVDPFFRIRPDSNGYHLFFLDNSGHAVNAEYDYLLLDLNEETYEIDRMIGPIPSSTVMTP